LIREVAGYHFSAFRLHSHLQTGNEAIHTHHLHPCQTTPTGVLAIPLNSFSTIYLATAGQTPNNKQQTPNNEQQTTNNKQQTPNNKQRTTNNEQQTTNNKQFTSPQPGLPRRRREKKNKKRFNETQLSEDAVALKFDGRTPVCFQGRNPESLRFGTKQQTKNNKQQTTNNKQRTMIFHRLQHCRTQPHDHKP